MSNELMNQEIREAIDAGERAIISLRAAQDKLNSARNWGIFDMVGGGFFSSLMNGAGQTGFKKTSKRTSGYSGPNGFKDRSWRFPFFCGYIF